MLICYTSTFGARIELPEKDRSMQLFRFYRNIEIQCVPNYQIPRVVEVPMNREKFNIY